jgi:uridine phosphorylase
MAWYSSGSRIEAGMATPPILDHKDPREPSVFAPEALLREARRQKQLAAVDVPALCVLDPDGDIVRRLRETGGAQRFKSWPCYHTELDTFVLAGHEIGIVGCVVGAPFAVLVAEELFASGCRFLLSITSAGQITPARADEPGSGRVSGARTSKELPRWPLASLASAAGRPPYFVIIDRALRDEGTSYHYAPAAEFAHADPRLVTAAKEALDDQGLHAVVGASWTTDAPFRETAAAIASARSKGVLAVEMEAAALYTLAQATGSRVLCLAHVTNTMGQAGHDFEKGEADGTAAALAVLEAIATRMLGTK